MRPIKNNGLYDLIKKDIKEHHGKIRLYKGEFCGGNDRCYGIFDFDSGDDPIIKVATGNKPGSQWFGILVHEYCHFLQWREQSSIWKQFEDSDFNLDEVIKNPKKHKKDILLLIRLEADCERRAIKLLKKYDIADLDEYIKEANAVLYKYAFLYTDSFWPKRHADLKHCQEMCETKIHRSYLKYLEIPECLYDIFANAEPN